MTRPFHPKHRLRPQERSQNPTGPQQSTPALGAGPDPTPTAPNRGQPRARKGEAGRHGGLVEQVIGPVNVPVVTGPLVGLVIGVSNGVVPVCGGGDFVRARGGVEWGVVGVALSGVGGGVVVVVGVDVVGNCRVDEPSLPGRPRRNAAAAAVADRWRSSWLIIALFLVN